MLFQIALIVFSVYAILKTRKQYAAHRVSKYWFIVLTFFWLVVIGVAIAPQTTDVVAEVVGVGRGADLLVYIAVVVLFYALYRLMVRQQRLSAELTELVRKLAVADARLPNTATHPEATKGQSHS